MSLPEPPQPPLRPPLGTAPPGRFGGMPEGRPVRATDGGRDGPALGSPGSPASGRLRDRAVGGSPGRGSGKEAADPAVRTLLLGLLVGALLGAAGGFAAGLFAFPLLFSQGSVGLSEGLTTLGAPRATGRFVQADSKERTRYGSGTVSVYEGEVRLETDFEVVPGPKYHLYLVPARGIDGDARVEETMFVDLGPLIAFVGAQSYRVPAGVDLADYGSVAVWSEQLNLLVSPAELSTSGN